jgi:outer membrane murein-binding lipoprotein Lpp
VVAWYQTSGIEHPPSLLVNTVKSFKKIAQTFMLEYLYYRPKIMIDTIRKRRTVLSTVAAGVASLAGCSSDTGEGTSTQTPDVETLDSQTDHDSSEQATADPQSERNMTSSAEETDQTATPEPAIRFNAELNSLTKCGTTCREIAYKIQNTGRAAADGVTVRIRVQTGGEQVYSETQSIDSIPGRAQKSGIVHQIDVGIGGGSKIKSNDGEVILFLEPEAGNGESETFSFERTLDV